MIERDHIAEDDLELYLLGRLPDCDAVAVEEHLLICKACQAACEAEAETLAELIEALKQCEPFVDVEAHQTREGRIELRVQSEKDVYIGRLIGRQLSGGCHANTRDQAMDNLRQQFAQMFPEHVCTSQCRQESRIKRVS